MRRRDFTTGLCGTLLGPLFGARAQERQTYRIGMVDAVSAEMNATNLSAFKRGLEELGYREGQSLVLDYRSADGDARRYPDLIRELIALGPDLIVARGTPAALAAKAATTTIPVVMAGLGEPLLVVESLARPGGNITGLSGLQPELETKRLELLKELVPSTAEVAAFLNIGNPVTGPQLKQLEKAAEAMGLRLRLVDVRSRVDIERGFAALDGSTHAIVVGLEALTQAHRYRIAELAAHHRMPAVYGGREFVEAGGLIFYGPSFPSMYRRAATYVDRIFKGAKPAELPVEQPTNFELLINLKTAKALGLTVPPTLLARADEVVE
jgi:putative tryptophan/tyrosine transport system substrate-binding protein